MKLRLLALVPTLLILHSAWADEKSPAWRSDPQHPLLQYRFVCMKGSQRVVWRNGYPGAVTLKALMRSSTYEGMEDVQIEPGATTNSDLDTLYCEPFRISVTRFSMAAPPPPAPTKDASVSIPPAAPPPAAPILVRFEPQTEPIPEIAMEAFASITIGLTEAEVRQKLGDPLSKISIPDDANLIETYRYNVTHDRTGVFRFANGIVTAIILPR